MDREPWIDPVLRTISGFKEDLVQQGHVRFVLDDVKYFVFPEGPHEYGLCLWKDMATGGYARWTFSSEDELMQAQIFNGKSISDRIGEIMTYAE